MSFVHKSLLGITAALATAAALPASAVTFGGSGWTPEYSSPSCSVTGSFADDWANIDVLDGAAFNATFADGDAGGNLCFSFINTSSTAAVVTLAVATVNQFGDLWGFLGGVQLVSEQAGSLWTVAEGVFDTEFFTFNIAANDILYFDWTYGEAYASSEFSLPQINFTVSASPVPLPAGGLLLIGALGGLAVLRRRKTLAA
jgi:hypothetical protein